ncbi:MAG TPA: carbohydrate-binding domain-containing protein [Oscillospiraceae bacterium]|nr:carbohydrate-binding domain-containing protein [Oscillospiraceae bacterium]
MKKFLSVLLTFCMAAALLAGCSSTGEEAESSENSGSGEENAYADAVQIVLGDDGITVDGAAASENAEDAVYVGAPVIYYEAGHDETYGAGSESDGHTAEEAAGTTVLTITQPGSYHVTGTLSNGQIAVDLGEDAATDESAVVKLILDGADITCPVAPAVIFYNVYETESTTEAGAQVVLADGSENTVTGSHVAKIYKEGTEDKLYKFDGAFYSKMTMSFDGEGSLAINADNEGLDSEMHLIVNSGTITISSMDDGINTNEDGVSVCTINGGSLTINAGQGSEGDGIDSNGDLIINGGTIVAMANPQTGDGGIDADGNILINGGVVIASGSRNDAVSTDSAQPYMELSFAATQSAGTTIRIEDENGGVLLETAMEKAFQSFTFSSADLAEDTTYHVYANGVQQQYTGNLSSWAAGTGGMQPGGQMPEGNFNPQEPPEGFDAQVPQDGEAPEMPEGNLDGTSGKQPGMRENVSGEMPSMPENGEVPQEPQGGQTSGENTTELSEPSVDFTITASIHSFSGVGDYAEASGKTALTFHVNEDDTVLSGDTVSIVYNGATDADGNTVEIDGKYVQFSIVDVPSENYSETVLLSDGSITDLLPTDAGTYCLTIAVTSDCADYTGSSQWVFTIGATSGS